MRTRKSWIARLVTVAFIATVSGCGYGFSSRTAKDIKSIAVPFFENRTPEPNLEISLTEQVINFLIADNTLSVVDEVQADATLEGVIVEFVNRPFSFNQDLNAEEYRVVVRVEATLFNRKTGEPIWEKKVLKGDGSYFIATTEPGFEYNDALEESIREITEQILNLTVQDW